MSFLVRDGPRAIELMWDRRASRNRFLFSCTDCRGASWHDTRFEAEDVMDLHDCPPNAA